MKKRVLAIGLDGFEISVALKMIDDGKLPYLAKMISNSAFFKLDHGDARSTGLAWEHFSTGQDPDSYKKWSAIDFNPDTYSVEQSSTRSRSFTVGLPVKMVTFDVPYLSLDGSDVLGMSNWGAHDPGVKRSANPPELLDEINTRFGAYPATKFIYGFVWPSIKKTKQMANDLVEAAKKRSEIIEWLFADRYPDWEIAIAVTSEHHSGIEALWYGMDENHPLHHVPSANAARKGLEDLYVETDKMLASLAKKFPDVTMLTFSMHGMGANDADVASMILLPEFLHQRSFGTPFLHPRKEWILSNGRRMNPNMDWTQAILPRMGRRSPDSFMGIIDRLRQKLGLVEKASPFGAPVRFDAKQSLSWMPLIHYQLFWPEMEAFAMPAYYEGQIRVNLKGREAQGIVALEDYNKVLEKLERDLAGLTDFETGRPVVSRFERPVKNDPMAANSTQCDLRIVWKNHSVGFKHSETGAIGPVPHRRPGGHTGEFGYATLENTDLKNGDYGTRSSFDVVPTILDLYGLNIGDNSISGRSLLND
ncbi:hypothetical protein A9Q96_05500 [Rhodobacterales bacterium 52_120_T64]|nr:hypothetical protein A9Q96_05500 [Rhodobacterales bacterium 52_120_T64]